MHLKKETPAAVEMIVPPRFVMASMRITTVESTKANWPRPGKSAKPITRVPAGPVNRFALTVESNANQTPKHWMKSVMTWITIATVRPMSTS